MKNLIFRAILAILCVGTMEGATTSSIRVSIRMKRESLSRRPSGTLWKFGNAFYTPITDGYTVLDSNLFAAASDEAQQTKALCDASYFNQGVITPT